MEDSNYKHWQKFWKELSSENKIKFTSQPMPFAQEAREYFPKTGKILELTAGNGTDSRFFAKEGYDVIETDFSEEVNKVALKAAKKEGLKLTVKTLDLNEDLPFENKIFDIVYSHMGCTTLRTKRPTRYFKKYIEYSKKGVY